MEESVFEKMKRLEEIAKNDEIYQVYLRSCEDLDRWYTRFLRFFPKAVKRKLTARIDYQRMCYQRMILLACLNMDFTN